MDHITWSIYKYHIQVMKNNKHDIDMIKKGDQKEIIAFRAIGLNHTTEGPTEKEERVRDSFGNYVYDSFGNYVYETERENQWKETQYNFGDHFDMNYFTAPFNGLYQFHANIGIRDDRTSQINMNDLTDFIESLSPIIYGGLFNVPILLNQLSNVNDVTRSNCSKIGYRSSRTMSCQANVFLRKGDEVGVEFSGNFRDLSDKTMTVFEGTMLKKA